MNRILKYRATNGICLSVVSAFYALVFILTSGNAEFIALLQYDAGPDADGSFLGWWSGFLAAGHQVYIACALLALTALVIVLLALRRRPYDEYHMARLMHCLIVALVLTMLAIAIFFLLILSDTSCIVEKFMFFITAHWGTVVLADLVYVLLYRRG